jgi:hypothetical protein
MSEENLLNLISICYYLSHILTVPYFQSISFVSLSHDFDLHSADDTATKYFVSSVLNYLLSSVN